MRGPTIRAFAARDEEQRIGQHDRRGSSKDDHHEQGDRGERGVHESDRKRHGGIVEQTEQGVRHAEELRPR